MIRLKDIIKCLPYGQPLYLYVDGYRFQTTPYEIDKYVKWTVLNSCDVDRVEPIGLFIMLNISTETMQYWEIDELQDYLLRALPLFSDRGYEDDNI